MNAPRVSAYHLSAEGLAIVQARGRQIRDELRLRRQQREVNDMLHSTAERLKDLEGAKRERT